MEPFEDPTTSRVGSTGLGARVASSFLSPAEQLREYQASFMATVHGEVERLVRGGYRREEAVEALLRRIRSLSADAALPTDKEVTALMRSHRLSWEDATRALVVRNAVSGLRRKGWDSASVMQELTSQLMVSDPLLPSLEQPTPTARLLPNAAQAAGFRSGVKRPLSAVRQCASGASDVEEDEEEPKPLGGRGAVVAGEEDGAAMMMQLVSPRKRACYSSKASPPPQPSSSCFTMMGGGSSSQPPHQQQQQARGGWSMVVARGGRQQEEQHHHRGSQHHGLLGGAALQLHQHGGGGQW